MDSFYRLTKVDLRRRFEELFSDCLKVVFIGELKAIFIDVLRTIFRDGLKANFIGELMAV